MAQLFADRETLDHSSSLARQLGVSLFWIYVAYSRWNAATYVAEEIEEPQRTLSRALALGTAMVASLYLALNILFIYATPFQSMKGVVAVGALAASRLFGSQVAGVLPAPRLNRRR